MDSVKVFRVEFEAKVRCEKLLFDEFTNKTQASESERTNRDICSADISGAVCVFCYGSECRFACAS